MTARKPIVIDPADSAQCAELPAGDWVDQLPIFGAGGLLTGARLWAGEVLTASPNQHLVDFDVSAAGFSSIIAHLAIAGRVSSDAIDRPLCSINTSNSTLTTVQVQLVKGRQVTSLGGDSLQHWNVIDIPVWLLVIGT